MRITLSEFLHAFYTPRGDICIEGCRAKKKVAAFFFDGALEGTKTDCLPYSESAFEKWVDGNRSPSSDIWSAVSEHFNEDHLIKELLKLLNSKTLPSVAVKLGIEIEAGQLPEKRLLVNAAIKQFRAIADGNGTAEKIANAEYKKRPEAIGLNTYLHGAIQKYKRMKILGGEEVDLDEYYVCNRIGQHAAVVAHLDKDDTIDDATLQKLHNFKNRGVLNRIFLIAASGFGKTLMLQHLFLQAARTQMDTGLLPVLIELRSFSHLAHDLVSCIVASVTHFGEKFSEDDARELLAKGQCQILLDGLDEMDPSEITEFQHKLTDFIDLYPDNQIILSSRECDALRGIDGFKRLYIHPFDNEQSQRLIDKLLRNVDDPSAKEKIQKYMDEGFIRKEGIFATNPMLLTFVVQNYQKLDEYAQARHLFYQEVYEAMLNDHDGDKNAYDRIFHSVSDVDEFTLVFREFCALSYLNADRIFSKMSFENYFKRLKSVEEVVNPTKLKWRSFLQDACATACMMYEESSKIFYIDPAFQEYLFALYMYQAPIDKVRELLKQVKDKSPIAYPSMNGFKMLYEMSADKAEIGMFLPYLDLVFRGRSEEEAFLQYLLNGYEEIGITVFNKEKAQQVDPDGTVSVYPHVNEPSCIPLLLILSARNQKDAFSAGTSDPRVWWEEYSQQRITLKDQIIGHILVISRDTLSQNPTKLRALADVLKDSAEGLYDTFLNVKEYHAQIAKKKRALTQTSEEDSGWREPV